MTNQWHPYPEETPEQTHEYCWVTYPDGKVNIAEFDTSISGGWIDDGGWVHIDPVAWILIPEPASYKKVGAI